MCGIAGYVGPRNAVDVVYDQLKRLEYRGYDSAGVAYLNGGGAIHVVKRAGKLSELGKLLSAAPSPVAEETPGDSPEPADQLPPRHASHLAIAHSRWATHGAPTDLNAHPHFDQYADIALIHNGIIENYLEIKQELARAGHSFQSETDTEVAAHLIGREHAAGLPLDEAVRRAVRRLRGAFAFVVFSRREPDRFVAARNASPLIVGLGEGENMVASDVPALLPYTREVLVIEDDRVATISRDAVTVTDLDGRPAEIQPMHVDWDTAAAEKGGYEHFMLKEIFEQPDVVRQALAGRIDAKGKVQLDNIFSDHVWQEIDRVNVIACGTAYHAGLMGKFLFEKMLRLPTDVFYSSEFRYGDPLLSERSLAVFVSQSGETADSLAALRLCKARRIRTLGIVNVVGSSIARECDRVVFTQAGPEISVASTKAYMAQTLVLMLLALQIAQVREMPGVRVEEAVSDLRLFADRVQETLGLEEQAKELAEANKDAKLVFFLGRNADAHVTREAALKLKEIAYVPTQECPAGEIKHGPLALVEKGTLAVFGATDAEVRDKLASSVREVQARGGVALIVTTSEDTTLDEYGDRVLKVPKTKVPYLDALLSVVPLQLLAYHMARARGCEIDQPRNLAKSVTVE
ncbi:MAG: glutamine--fructose-6-phosphate transaminase (isomerizing) [Fimbriimonadaceae bacterium]|nr:glutamine--fructose-6-phosphate transaminase (isomerizing) [Fimbriimonadaceae bacterium]QYK55668.1 MAG: glutamine--fructose-6-phosphate transaminase (isomerizing) [Fimbriimonadaceae bacterium]